MDVTMTVKFTNIYEDGEEIVLVKTLTVPTPEDREPDTMEDWAQDYMFPETGTGRTQGDAGYFVKIMTCDDPSLVDYEFEYGI